MSPEKRRARARRKAASLRNGTYRPTQWGDAKHALGKEVIAHRDAVHSIHRSNEGLSIVTIEDTLR